MKLLGTALSSTIKPFRLYDDDDDDDDDDHDHDHDDEFALRDDKTQYGS